jgi:DNA-binding SARP family transcriptional activator
VTLPDGPGPATSTAPTLDARLLGPLEMSLGGRRVEVWHGRKGALLLAYLLLHRDRTTLRDALAVEFWPDAAPAASRNRLHVAMHALRADLHRVSSVPVVLFDRGYRVNPELRVRLDTEAFDGAIGLGRRAEDSADPGTALVAYQRAVDYYRGDLLADFPYEGWTLLPRQHYRVRLLDALGRGAHLAFEVGRYDESAAYAQRLLQLDFFREDVHRLLMRSYCRLGRPHLALRQFDECSRQLVQELGIRPATETVDLYRQVRERASV